jgi:DNA-directed RNA polymerase specialized sigma24 family protein
MNLEKASFESKILEINKEIDKRKNKWSLTALAWMDFNDVAQILRIHIYKKWDMYDQKQPLAPWINRIASNQIKNLIRNTYGNYSRPCLKCAAADQEDGCNIYGTQCSQCPLYAKWEKSKKSACNIKLPVALENHSQEVHNIPHNSINIEKTAENIHKKMQQTLKPLEWKFYSLHFIEHKSEEDTAKIMGYKTTEKNRKIGYKQVKNLKKLIITKVKKYLYNGEIDID